MTHYFDEQPKGPIREEKITQVLRGKEYSLISANGLFSREHVDNATKLLINKCQIDDAKRVVDLGCGWGPIVCVLSSEFPEKEFFAIDINQRAVFYTKKNCKKYKSKNTTILQSNIFSKIDEEKFDVVLTNPPYSAGRSICFSFITESFNHLNVNGSLQLVARHQKGGKVLMKKMEDVFGNVETIGKQSGFHIYKSIKTNNDFH
jgi:16S rRNA G1207 methylase RsmC